MHCGPHGALPQAALGNGEQVRMWRVEKDRSGRRWAYVTPTSGGAPGYVFREHLVCFCGGDFFPPPGYRCGLKNLTAKAIIPPTTSSIVQAATSKYARPIRKSAGCQRVSASQ